MFFESYYDQEVVFFFHVKYSYLSILPDGNADIFYVSMLISYCSFLSLILSSFAMISFDILSTKFSET